MAAILQSPSSPGKDDTRSPTTPNPGQNTLISHEGRWYNVGRAAHQALVRSNQLGNGVGIDDQTGTILEPSALQDGSGKPDQDTFFRGGGDFVTNTVPEKVHQQSRSGDENGSLDDQAHAKKRTGYGESEIWDGLGVQSSPELEATQLSPSRILELASSPLLSLASGSSVDVDPSDAAVQECSPVAQTNTHPPFPEHIAASGTSRGIQKGQGSHALSKTSHNNVIGSPLMSIPLRSKHSLSTNRPPSTGRTVSTPVLRIRSPATPGGGAPTGKKTPETKQRKPIPTLRFQDKKAGGHISTADDREPSPMPPSIPIPPLSLSTYLQLELSSDHPSPLYIHRSFTSEFPYESSRVKLERLLNFLLLPPQLEQVLGFGALACLDSWLYSFTILPLRFLKALSILGNSWSRNVIAEARFIGSFVYIGAGRMWQRKWQASLMESSHLNHPKHHDPDTDSDKAFVPAPNSKSGLDTSNHPSSARRHRRNKSTPSALLPNHKADILKGFLIGLTCMIMMYFDPSRMYHGIRGQAAIKLYVIYNVLEVCDRLFSALGQDVLECLFSQETLERKSNGHSKVIPPVRALCACPHLQSNSCDCSLLPSHYAECCGQFLLERPPHSSDVQPIR